LLDEAGSEAKFASAGGPAKAAFAGLSYFQSAGERGVEIARKMRKRAVGGMSIKLTPGNDKALKNQGFVV
jgi:hypothetical protein